MDAQEALDRAFGVTPDERAVLRSGEIPPTLLRRVHAFSRSSFSSRRSLLFMLVLPAGLALALPAALSWLKLGEWRHERRVLATRPALRTLEGPAETVRTWQYGYGECYYLWSDLQFVGQSEKPVCLFDKLGPHVISGWARVFLATVPSRKADLAPYYETPVALEVAADTFFVEREPGKAPPTEPLRVNVPAD